MLDKLQRETYRHGYPMRKRRHVELLVIEKNKTSFSYFRQNFCHLMPNIFFAFLVVTSATSQMIIPFISAICSATNFT